jgi:raffinose/stachyose/melibiose transport system permease protein
MIQVDKKRLPWHLFPYILPALILFALFAGLPVLLSMRISLYEWPGIGTKTYVGLGNFHKLFFEEPWRTRFWGAFLNTSSIYLYFTLFQNVPALILAYLLSRGLRGSKIFRAIFFLPATMSVVMVGFIARLLFNPIMGPFNKLMEAIGLAFLSKPWLGLPETVLPTIAFVGSWQYIGIPMVLFLAGFLAIPEELLEASRIDGANELQTFWYVVLPQLAPIIGLVMVLTFAGNFTEFETVYSMAGPRAGPNYAADVFGTYFYRTSFGGGESIAKAQVGLGAAISMAIFVIVSVGILLWQWYNRRVDKWLGR